MASSVLCGRRTQPGQWPAAPSTRRRSLTSGNQGQHGHATDAVQRFEYGLQNDTSTGVVLLRSGPNHLANRMSRQ